MNDSPASLSDEALAQLIFQSKATVQTPEISSRAVFDRVQKFNDFYAALSNRPEGVALLYQDTKAAAVRCREIGEKVTVGRLPKSERHPTACDLALEDEEMSRRHFEVALSDGLYVLRDLQSRNGTSVNNHSNRISEIVLKSGDMILAGRSVFVFTGD